MIRLPMEPVSIAVKRVRENARLPAYMTPGAAGMDLYAALAEPVVLNPGERCLIPTGIALAIPPGFEAQVRPRSGLALRQGVTMLNSPGTIDSDFRGEIGVIIVNHGQEPVTFAAADRVAQLVIAPVVRARLEESRQLEETARGDGGFGHTGVNGGD